MTGLLKIAAGVVVLVGALYALYGLAGSAEKLLMAMGAIEFPDGSGENAVIWHLVVWEPVWMLGGALFLLTAWRFRGKQRNAGWFA